MKRRNCGLRFNRPRFIAWASNLSVGPVVVGGVLAVTLANNLFGLLTVGAGILTARFVFFDYRENHES
ncbi:MAG: hypothetical protein F4053_01120 [Proteobacteria bacterium]|nr:hypothetical protein [Pseudomonadota bacterium]